MSEKSKKLLLFSGLFLLAGVMWSAINVKQAQARQSMSIGPARGDLKNNDYISVCNDEAYDMNSGSVLVFKSGSRSNGVSVTTTTSYGDGLVAGVVPSSTTLESGSCGIIQVYGYHPNVQIASNTTAGQQGVSSATGRYAAAYQVEAATITVDNSSGNEYGVATSTSAQFGTRTIGKFLDTTTGSSTVKMWLNIK